MSLILVAARTVVITLAVVATVAFANWFITDLRCLDRVADLTGDAVAEGDTLRGGIVEGGEAAL